jgi:acetoacetyl-CoA synthetase
MLGRSDGTLNPNGVRFGSAEIYSILETIPEVDDSLCVGQRSPATHEERVLLFLKTEGGKPVDEAVAQKIRELV